MNWASAEIRNVPQRTGLGAEATDYPPMGPVFDYLSPLDLIHFSLTSRRGYLAVTDYRKDAFSITALLGRYFSQTNVLGFRFLQAQIGFVISGSSALQFFGRVYYPESDLDIYVEARREGPLMDWLTRVGYTYIPDPLEGRFPSLDQKLHKLDNQTQNRCPGVLKPSLEDESALYRNRSMVKVYNFRRDTDPTKKIQLILTYNAPLELILAYHSTCVMNFITHDTAYSLFPYATFEERVALVIKKSRDERCLDKYRARGWTILNQVPLAEARDPRSDFYSRSRRNGTTRYVGDKRCWTIPLSPKLEAGTSGSTKYLNSWQLFHKDTDTPNSYGCDMRFKILRSRILENSYTIALKPAMFLEPILSALEYHIGYQLDRDVEGLMRQYFQSFNGL
ncbi:hypothetical protein BDN72DRAFT_902536 [Pluteus cervinus]|uniref:Uncharacterized protein n=1 Tax=Pluteus cervinus TaxID=181527 RepID=A0ACD3ABQ1_9AGAR|nr:hypothetical protein BDN72DRAFT_902536 [Pluteus cervinus]